MLNLRTFIKASSESSIYNKKKKILLNLNANINHGQEWAKMHEYLKLYVLHCKFNIDLFKNFICNNLSWSLYYKQRVNNWCTANYFLWLNLKFKKICNLDFLLHKLMFWWSIYFSDLWGTEYYYVKCHMIYSKFLGRYLLVSSVEFLFRVLQSLL